MNSTVTIRIRLADFLIFRDFPTTWAAPGSPEVDDQNFSFKVSKAEAATIEFSNLSFAKAFRHEEERAGNGWLGFGLGLRFSDQSGRD
jgi:hypothetical protein